MFGGLGIHRASTYSSLVEWVLSLDRALSKLGAPEIERTFVSPSLAEGASSAWSEFNSATVGQLRVEIDRLHKRAASLSGLPGNLRRPLNRLTRRVEKLESSIRRNDPHAA